MLLVVGDLAGHDGAVVMVGWCAYLQWFTVCSTGCPMGGLMVTIISASVGVSVHPT